MSVKRMSDEEFEQQFAEATVRGKALLHSEPQAHAATYDAATHRLIIEMKNGLTLLVPVALMQGLRDADPALIAEVELMPRGAALHWEKLDQDFSIAGLLNGVFGNEVWMAEIERHDLPHTPEVKRTG